VLCMRLSLKKNIIVIATVIFLLLTLDVQAHEQADSIISADLGPIWIMPSFDFCSVENKNIKTSILKIGDHRDRIKMFDNVYAVVNVTRGRCLSMATRNVSGKIGYKFIDYKHEPYIGFVGKAAIADCAYNPVRFWSMGFVVVIKF
jgi:hypothetical protein